MGNDLLKISETQIAGAVVETSDARELHEKLNVARDFNLWIAEQIKRARLVADRDYLTYENVVQMPSGAKRRKECALTLDAAKHVAMMSGSERGFEIREFFIDREKTLAAIERAKSRIALPDFTDPVAAARAWADAKESEQKAVALANEQAGQLEAQKPAVEFVERYVKADGPKGIRQVCQLLNANEREFVQFLIDAGIMYRLDGALTPMACHRHTGRFVVKAGVSRETDHAFNQAKFTPKGVEWIAGEWGKYIVDLNQRASQSNCARTLSHAHH